MNDLLSSPTTLLLLIGLVFLTGGVAIFYFLRNRRNTFATPLERATFGTLHTVALAAPSQPRVLPRLSVIVSAQVSSSWRR